MGNFAIEKYDRISLNGITRKGDKLGVFCAKELEDSNMPEWLVHIYKFIKEWISDDDFVIAHTSGSTGKPKEIKLQKKHMLASAQKTVQFFELNNDKDALLCLSANYIAGKMMLVRAFVGGFNLILTEPTGTPLKNISQHIDFAAMVPLQVYNSLTYFNDNVKSVIIGGGVVSEEIKKQLQKLPTQFYETYGMTETVSHVGIREIIEKETSFKAIPNVEFCQDERACLKIIAPDICEEEVITNDMVHLLNKHEFEFLGRYDNVINTGGVKVIPEEVEKKLSGILSMPFVISSIQDEKLGERVVLVLDEKSQISSLPISVSQVLSKFEIPKQIVKIEFFPLTNTGKIKRNEVKLIIRNLYV